MTSVQKLIKNFQCYPKKGKAPLMVGFVADLNDNGGVLWNFGDDGKDTQSTVEDHTYSKPGTYNGYLQVTDPYHDTVSEKQPFTIVVSAAPEEGIITKVSQSNAVVSQNTEVTFGISAKDITVIKKVIWHYGDKSPDDPSNGNAHHTYRNKGSFEGNVTLFTGDGKQDSRPFYMLVY